MSTNHFSALPEPQQERLALLMEECGEVVQAIGKILRHGYYSTNCGKNSSNNRGQLEDELGDVLAALELMLDSGDLSRAGIEFRSEKKLAKVWPFLHHQK